jgi:transposase-like protein
LTDDEAYQIFHDFRWADSGGKPYCPSCGCFDPYSIRRRRYRCSSSECRSEFSVTSGTVFSNRKLSFKKLIMAIWEEISAVKGLAALHLTRKLQVQYKTAWVLLMKIREAIGLRRDGAELQGVVQIDGKYIGGIQRQANKKEDRVDFRLKENQNGKRRCVIAMREANIDAPNRTITRVVVEENNLDSWAFVKRHAAKDALVVADEHKAYDDLVGLVNMSRVNHSNQFMAEDGTHTNVVESFFSRVEKAYVGIYHRFSMKYLDWYAANLAWKEDTRYMGIRWQLADVLRTVVKRPISRNLAGYWQGAAERIAYQVWIAGQPPRLIARSPKETASRRPRSS